MITTQEHEKAKSKSIVDYLKQKGIEPVHKYGSEYVYLSPFTGEKKGSMNVSNLKNVFNDYSSGLHGDVITLCMHLEKVEYPTAVHKLLGGEFIPFERIEAPTVKQSTVLKVTEVKSPALLSYAKSRCISQKVLNEYCKEVTYMNDRGRFFAIAFQNTIGGFELRTEKFKGCLGEKSISFIDNQNSLRLAIFEGFFSFMSYVEWLKKKTVKGKIPNIIVLNSTSTLKSHRQQIYDIIQNYEFVDSFLDNDEGGQKALKDLQTLHHNVLDCSSIMHPKQSDFNEYLISLKN